MPDTCLLLHLIRISKRTHRLQSTPTNIESKQYLIVNDYWRKQIKLTSCTLQVFLENPSEMKAIDRKGDSLWEEAWTFKYGPEEKSPVMESFFSDDPKNND